MSFKRLPDNVQEIDHGWRQIVQELKEAGYAYSKVGFPEEGKTPGRHSMSKLIEVAAGNEFGNEKVPERSFMRTAVDENMERISSLQEEAIRKVSGLQATARSALFELGEEVEEIVRQKVLSGDSSWPKLSDFTIKRKNGDDTMLIETGQMIDSIQHKEVFPRR